MPPRRKTTVLDPIAFDDDAAWELDQAEFEAEFAIMKVRAEQAFAKLERGYNPSVLLVGFDPAGSVEADIAPLRKTTTRRTVRA